MFNLKKFNTEFQCTLSVDALAEKLLETIYPKNNWIKEFITVEIEVIASGVKTDLLEDKCEMTANDIRVFCIEYLKDLPYHIRLVESIIDGIKDNSEGCSNVFNTIHGWVKLPTPSDKKDESDKLVERLTIRLREEIGDGWNDDEIVEVHEMDFNGLDYNTQWFDFNTDYLYGVKKGKLIYIPYITKEFKTKIKRVCTNQANFDVVDNNKLKNYLNAISFFMLKYANDSYL